MNKGLVAWGWEPRLEEAYEALELSAELCLPGRILSQREDTFTVMTEEGLRWAHPAGVLFHRCTAVERPGVGDWVVLEAADCEISEEEEEISVTHSVTHVLPRKSCFVREAPGGRGEAQVVATNVDIVFVVNPADDINLNRIERFAVAILSGGARPAAILSKGDLVDDGPLEENLKSVSQLVEELTVIACAHADDDRQAAREAVSPYLQSGKTYALVGASGVGKSTLVNALLGESVQQTGDVREGDSKGRHLTSFRELFPLPGGALIMDTPGVREFAMWSMGEGVGQVFADIEELEQKCRFSDCSHQSEPGCAVREAVEAGLLSERRLSNWRGLREELEENQARRDRRQARRERSQFERKKKRDKRFSRR